MGSSGLSGIGSRMHREMNCACQEWWAFGYCTRASGPGCFSWEKELSSIAPSFVYSYPEMDLYLYRGDSLFVVSFGGYTVCT